MRDLQTFLKQVCRVGLYVACGAARAENLLGGDLPKYHLTERPTKAPDGFAELTAQMTMRGPVS